MEIVRKSERIQVEPYRLDFEWRDTPGAGFNFPCDKDDTLIMEEIPEAAQANLI